MLLLPYSSHLISQLTLWRWKLCHYYVTKCKVLACTRRWHQTQSLFIELGWNLYGRIFLRRANDTVMDGNLALLRTLLTPNVWDFTSSNSLQTPAGCATIYFNSVTNDMESVQIPQDKSSAPPGWGGGRGRAAWALFGAEQIYVFRFSLALAIDQVCCYSSCIRSFFCSSQQLFQNCIYPDIPEFERMHGPQCSLQRYWQ